MSNNNSSSDESEIEVLLGDEDDQFDKLDEDEKLEADKTTSENAEKLQLNNVDNTIDPDKNKKSEKLQLSSAENQRLYPSVYDLDLDSISEKPWRSVGADPSDYFNYGFTEDSWRAYCARQVWLIAKPTHYLDKLS